MNIIFNPAYLLKPDKGRTLLMSKEVLRENTGGESDFNSFIHPIHGMILTFFDGRPYAQAVADAAQYLSIDSAYIEKFAGQLLENSSRISVNIEKMSLIFPEKTLIYSDKMRTENYRPEEFAYEKVDLRLKRHASPTDITLMITNRCATDCVYCYADRRTTTDCQVPLERLFEIIDEAKALRVRSFNVIGGEFFLYKHWRPLLIKLKEAGYSTFLSTKVPIGEKAIADIAAIGVEDLQVSLDTLRQDNLCYILKVKPQYWEQIKQTLVLLEKYGINTLIHTILNSRNHHVEDMRSIYDFLKERNNIKYWRADIATGSIYLEKGSFNKVRADKNQLRMVKSFLEELKEKEQPGFEIKTDGIDVAGDNMPELSFDEKQERFISRGFCTANYSQMFILPDGKVTTCEELYWHPQFNIGDVKTQGLKELWQSEKAEDLFTIPQYKIGPDSPCSVCPDYYQCREHKQVCWRDIIKAYGEDKWYYPDVKCPKAPEPLYTFKI